MLMWIILSSAFIAVFLLIRALFSKKINAVAMYVLWMLVAVRLLIPTYIPMEFNLFAAQNIPSITHQVESVEDSVSDFFTAQESTGKTEGDTLIPAAPADTTVQDGTENQDTTVQANNGSANVVIEPNAQTSNLTKHPFLFIWIIGILGFGCYFIITNIRFSMRLKRSRVLLNDYECKLPVYLVKWLPAPCLTGLIRPAIYVNEQIYDIENPHYVIEHEYMHYRHKDMIWMLIQNILLCIHWFNPLVWIASYLFRKDCEYACDEAVAKALDTEERIAYGRTLLFFETTKRNTYSVFSTATSMSMDGKTMKKRVHLIINYPPKRIISSVIAIFLILVLFVGAFVVNSSQKESEEGVTYELSLRIIGRNAEKITSNQITVPPGDFALSLSEQISDDVVNGKVEGDFIEGGVQNAILNIDYPFEQTQRDGTVVVAFEHIMSDVKEGQVITVTITEELQERLGLLDDQIVITCRGYDSKIWGSWELETESPVISSVTPGLEEGQIINCIFRYEFYEDGTGKWIINYDEQYAEIFPDQEFAFQYTLDGDRLEIIREDGLLDLYTISFSGDNLIMDGRMYIELTPAVGYNNAIRQFYKLGIQYAGEDVNGNVASDIVEKYYEDLNIGADVDIYFTDFRKPTNGWGYGIKSATLTHCEIIDESDWFKSDLFESDIMNLQLMKNEFYAWCIVQTADEVVRDDGSVEKRIFAYYLVMESANSEWKIQDYGYPPYYTPEDGKPIVSEDLLIRIEQTDLTQEVYTNKVLLNAASRIVSEFPTTEGFENCTLKEVRFAEEATYEYLSQGKNIVVFEIDFQADILSSPSFEKGQKYTYYWKLYPSNKSLNDWITKPIGQG